MENRRQFFKKSIGFIAGAGIFFTPLSSFVKNVYGKTNKVILPKGTKREDLIQKNPKSFDTRNLEVTPLKDFETMGITDHAVDLDKWRLIVKGAVGEPLMLTYGEVKGIPSMVKEILLICPGFFAIHGHWKWEKSFWPTKLMGNLSPGNMGFLYGLWPRIATGANG